MGKFLAEAYRGAFGADEFHGLFDSISFAHDQNVDLALAEWHALGAFVFTYCLWVVYNKRNKVSSILDSFQPALLSSLRLDEVREKRFLEIASDREKDYMHHYLRWQEARTEDKDHETVGRDLICFFNRAAARITGRFSPELDLQGIPQPGALSIVVGLTEYVMGTMTTTKAAIEKFGPK